jgi:fatty acid desaturase
MTDPGRARRTALDAAAPDRAPDPRPVERRPAIERIGLAIIAAVVIAIFGAIAAASFASGEPFLALMAALGALMTVWVAGMAVFRG